MNKLGIPRALGVTPFVIILQLNGLGVRFHGVFVFWVRGSRRHQRLVVYVPYLVLFDCARS